MVRASTSSGIASGLLIRSAVGKAIGLTGKDHSESARKIQSVQLALVTSELTIAVGLCLQPTAYVSNVATTVLGLSFAAVHLSKPIDQECGCLGPTTPLPRRTAFILPWVLVGSGAIATCLHFTGGTQDRAVIDRTAVASAAVFALLFSTAVSARPTHDLPGLLRQEFRRNDRLAWIPDHVARSLCSRAARGVQPLTEDVVVDDRIVNVSVVSRRHWTRGRRICVATRNVFDIGRPGNAETQND